MITLFFLECWDNNPDNRPTIFEVIDRLIEIMSVDNLDNLANLDILHEQNLRIDEIDEIKNTGSTNISINSSDAKEYFRSRGESSNDPLNKIFSKAVDFINKNL